MTRRAVAGRVGAGQVGAGQVGAGRAWRRRAWFGFLTLSGLAKRGFFIPYRYAESIPPAGKRLVYAGIEELFAGQEAQFHSLLGWIDELSGDLNRIESAAPAATRWGQSWFPRLDAAAAYVLLRRMAPRRVIEVGSGHSTRFLARAVADGGLATRITAIDPAPRADLSKLAVTLMPMTVQQAGARAFADLAAGDFLMIDSSHILMPGSDVDFLLGHILPGLPAGVFVHLHDIFLPDGYPPEWEWRGYNEQLGVLPLVLSRAWEVVFSSHYVATRMADSLAASAAGGLPLPPGALESSLWLKSR